MRFISMNQRYIFRLNFSLYFLRKAVLLFIFAFMNRPLDTAKHKGQRKLLIDKLAAMGIKDLKVLDAMLQVPRHWFMDSGLESHAYDNKAFPIAANQTISHPYTVAFQSQLLEIKPGDVVLEIGTGSGYQTAVLMALGIKTYTIERQQELFKKTQRLFTKLSLKPKKVVFGDGYLGMPQAAPFDGIVVTAGAPDVPRPLLQQLAVGGHLVIPIGKDEQIMTRFTRKSENEFDKETFGAFRFVPMLKDKN